MPDGTWIANDTSPRAGFGVIASPRRGADRGPCAASEFGIVYHGAVVTSRRTNASRLSATFSRPVADGCVPSLAFNSLHAHVRPSERGFSPSAHRYGPHESHGATTGPCPAS